MIAENCSDRWEGEILKKLPDCTDFFYLRMIHKNILFPMFYISSHHNLITFWSVYFCFIYGLNSINFGYFWDWRCCITLYKSLLLTDRNNFPQSRNAATCHNLMYLLNLNLKDKNWFENWVASLHFNQKATKRLYMINMNS